MEFNIKTNSTLPVLKMAVVKDGRGDDKDFINFIETSTLFFSMVDVNTGVSKIHMEPAGFVEKTFIDPNTPTEYYIYFKFQKKHLNKSGRFEGQFTIKNESGTLILPIREQLFINIIDSQGSDSIVYVNNLNLTAEISPGSTIIKYTLSSDNPTSYDTTVTFNHILKVFTGDTLTISTGITLNSFQSTTSFVLTFDDVDFNNLNKQSRFSEVDVFPIPVNEETKISEITIFNPPTPTPTSTQTPTPTETPILSPSPTPTETPTVSPTPSPTPIFIYDAILVDPETYLKVGNDTYLRYVDPVIPTPTPTPTQTPTPTITPSSTPIFIYDAVLVESDIYLNVGSDFYLRFIDPPTPTPTPTPTITPTNIAYYYSTNLYDCNDNCQFAFPTPLIVFSQVPLIIGKFYVPDIQSTISYEVLSLLGPQANPWDDLTESTEYDNCVDSCLGPQPSPTPTPTPTNTETPTQTPTTTMTPTPSFTPNCVRQIVVPTLWDGGTSINSNQLQLTQTSETLQIQVNDIITDNIGATSFVGIVSSDGTYTYVFTGSGGGVAFPCQFPLTFSGSC
jgi:hypothetical protein